MAFTKKYELVATLNGVDCVVLPGVATIVESVFGDDAVLISFVIKFNNRLPADALPRIERTDVNVMLLEDQRAAIVHVIHMEEDRLYGVGNIANNVYPDHSRG